MSSKTIVLVTGATGQAGAEVCAALVGRPGVEVRAGYHTAAKKDLLPAGVHPVPLDTADPATVKAAIDGVTRLFLLTPGGPIGPPSTRVIVDATAGSSVERIVRLSSIDPEVGPQAPTDLWALATEAMVRDTGLEYTFLRPPWFFQNFSKGYFVPMVMQRTLALPFGDGVAGWLDSRDLGLAAASALLEEGHAGKTYTLTGPKLISVHEIAAAITRVTSVEVRYQALTDEQWIQATVDAGGPVEAAQATLALISKTRMGLHEELHEDLERLCGRPLLTVDDWADDHKEVLTSLVHAGPPTGPPL